MPAAGTVVVIAVAPAIDTVAEAIVALAA